MQVQLILRAPRGELAKLILIEEDHLSICLSQQKIDKWTVYSESLEYFLHFHENKKNKILFSISFSIDLLATNKTLSSINKHVSHEKNIEEIK